MASDDSNRIVWPSANVNTVILVLTSRMLGLDLMTWSSSKNQILGFTLVLASEHRSSGERKHEFRCSRFVLCQKRKKKLLFTQKRLVVILCVCDTWTKEPFDAFI